jgi:hypothetical protein
MLMMFGCFQAIIPSTGGKRLVTATVVPADVALGGGGGGSGGSGGG